MEKPKNDILIVDDEPDIRELIKDILEDEGYGVRLADSGTAARKEVGTRVPDLMLLDIWMPGEDGISLLKEFKMSDKNTYPVIIMSGHGTVETAIKATRLGAYDFIEKPLTINKLLQCVRDALAKEDPGNDSLEVRPIIGDSAMARTLRRTARELIVDDKPVLIYGEAGTGKRVFAAGVHVASARGNRPFVEWDDECWFAGDTDTVTNNLHALSNKAKGGTLFIPHVDIMPKEMLRILAEQVKNNTGNTNTMRLMASCRSPDIAGELSPQKIGALQTIYIPELKERTEDIPELLSAAVDYHNQRERLPYRRFSIAAQNRLRHYEWHENMRELDNLVRELLLNSNGVEIDLREVEEVMRRHSPTASDWFLGVLKYPLREARELFEKAYLQQLLADVGNMNKLSERAGMERTHLYRKLRTLGIKTHRN